MDSLAKQLSLLRLGFSSFEIKQNQTEHNYHHQMYGNFHHAAFIFEQKGRSINILSKGVNYIIGNQKSIHAENDAIFRLKPRKNKKMKKINLIVIRTSKIGKLGSSQPCYHCVQNMIMDLPLLGYKLNNIYYSNNDESITCVKFNKFIQKNQFHISGFYRKKYLN
jgi:cytidine deaminase